MNGIRSILSPIIRSIQDQSIQHTSVRFRTRPKYLRRFGYESNLLIGELLPRLKDGDRVMSLPTYRPKDSWAEKRALFGQNDYIDILGDTKIHPIKVQSQIPAWLQGFKGNEFQMLLRKREAVKFWCFTKPTKWDMLNRRIKHLYQFLNRRTKTGPWPKKDYRYKDF